MNTKSYENKDFLRNLAAVESLERSAAPAGRVLAEQLARPTARRDDMTPAAQVLSDRLAAAHRQMDRLRRSPVRPASGEAGALRAVDTRLRHWTAVERAVGDCIAGHEWPLLPEPPSRLDLRAAQGVLMSDAFTRAHRAFNTQQQDAGAIDRGAFDDIPHDTAGFIAAVHMAYRIRLATKTPHPWRFLDVGCGGGMKVVLAADFFDEAAGLEVDPGFAAAARQTLAAMGSRRCEVIESDALTFDGYGRYDVIYLYRPIHDLDVLMALEDRIVAQCPPGGILIAPYRTFAHRAASLGCRHLGGRVYLKDPCAERFAALVAEARRMGPHVFGADQDPPRGLGWLRPLWLACAANGICPA